MRGSARKRFQGDYSKHNHPILEVLEDRRLLSAGTINAQVAVTTGTSGIGYAFTSPLGVRTVWPQFLDITRDAANPGTYAGLPAAGDTLATFCIEPNAHIEDGDQLTYEVNTLDSIPSPGPQLSPTQALRLRELYGRFYNDIGNDQVKIVSFQTAVWELSLDTDMNALTGSFSVFADTNPAVIAQTQSYLDALNGQGPLATLAVLTNPDKQDLIIEVPGTSPAFLPASLSGHVYFDVDNNGVFDTSAGDSGIAGAQVTLSGTDINGNAVHQVAMTDSAGAYAFVNLQPAGVGGYTLTETQPGAYADGKDSIGTQGGVAGNDVFSQIPLVSGQNGTDNNFGEVLQFCVGDSAGGATTLGTTSKPAKTVKLKKHYKPKKHHKPAKIHKAVHN